jgi:hypothetical protein
LKLGPTQAQKAYLAIILSRNPSIAIIYGPKNSLKTSMTSTQTATQLPNFPNFSGHIAQASAVTVHSPSEALIFQNDPSAVLVATNFVSAKESSDLSSPGYLQIDPKQNHTIGYTQHSFEERATFWDKELKLVISESGNVGKAFALLSLKGLFIRDEHDLTPGGINLLKFAKATDAFLKDLVHGWPKLDSLEGQALAIANYCASQLPKAAQTVLLAQHLQHILHAKDLNQFDSILQKERERAVRAATFPRAIVEGAMATISLVEELDPTGFHPPTFCGLSDTICQAHICVVARPQLGIVSVFAGSPEIAMLEPTKGLAETAAYLNKMRISLDQGEPISTWGGNFNRLGCGPRRFTAEECRAVAKLVAMSLAQKY